MESLSDFELIGKILNEDREYFSELISRYKNLVYSIILRMINRPTEAEDLAQEVFIKIYNNLDKYYPEFKFSTWVIRITTNHVIDFRRKKVADYAPLEDVEYDLAVPDTPEENFIRKEERRNLENIINNLPDMYKIPIVLYHQQGLSYQEIAEVIDEPLSKVKNRIFRARRLLKEKLMGLN
jgi:RNA polymerase sigma-70 factor (ECF subfamily)